MDGTSGDIYYATLYMISIYFAGDNLGVIGLSIVTLAPVSEAEIQFIVELSRWSWLTNSVNDLSTF